MARNEYAPREEYTGTGGLAQYSFDFKIEDASHLLVVVADTTGAEVQRVRGTDTSYLDSVTFDAEEGGGTVTLKANLPSGYRIVLLQANDEPTQEHQFKNKFDFTLKRVETALDSVVGQTQRAHYLADRGMRLNDLDDTAGFNPVLPPGVAGAADVIPTTNPTGTGWAPVADWISIPDLEAASAAAIASAASAAASAAQAVAAANSATAASGSVTDAAADALAAAASAAAAQTARLAAEAAAVGLENAETNAAASATSAATSAANASTSETNAVASAVAADASADAAAASAATATSVAAGISSIAAEVAAVQAAQTATEAARDAALAAEADAETAAASVASGVTAAAASAAAALTSENNAETAETNAAASAAAAATAQAAAELAETNAETAAAQAAASALAAAVGVSRYASFTNDAAFVANKGSSAAAGDAYFSSDENHVRVYDGTSWENLVNGYEFLNAIDGIANTGLSNLSASTSINAALVPDSANARDLGSTSYHWRDLFVRNIKSNAGVLELQGTALHVNAKSASDPSTTNTGSLYYNTSDNKFKYYDGTSWNLVGSGSGSGGGINYIANPDAESATTGWATYADAAGTSPVDGTGGSPTITWARSTSSPLRNTASFRLTKPASNVQGQGVSYLYTHPGKVERNQISFEYKIVSGTYATGDIRVYLVDVTTGAVIEPNGVQVENVGLTSDHIATFQTNSASTSYRFCIHVASTSTSAYTIDFDSITVGPSIRSIGSFISDTKSKTPIWSGRGTLTVTNDVLYMWQQGDRAYFQGHFGVTGGTGAASALVLTFPDGLQIDTSKASTGVTAGYGWWSMYDDSGASTVEDDAHGWIAYNSATSVNFRIPRDSNTLMGSALATNDRISFAFDVPILGWGSNMILSSETDGRKIIARYRTTSARTVTNTTRIDYDIKEIDTHNAVTTGASWAFRAPRSEYYRITVQAAAGSPVGAAVGLIVYQSNTSVHPEHYLTEQMADGRMVNGSSTIYVPAGQTVHISSASGTASNLGASTNGNWVCIESVSGTSTIAWDNKPPTSTRLTSGTALTYTTPQGAKYIIVKAVGAGGGGSGSGTASFGAGGTGGSTTFGGIGCNGGVGASAAAGAGGGGAVASVSIGTLLVYIPGGSGGGGAYNGSTNAYLPGGHGGISYFGAAGYAGGYDNAGGAAASNSGSGGGGGGSKATAASYSGAGGGAGAYVEVLITNPAATYTYTVGQGGASGTAGTNGLAGGGGGSGCIIVEEYY